MLKSLSLFLIIVLSNAAVGRSENQPAVVAVHNLRCEYLKNPLGIDVLDPRLSWELQGDGRGLKQTGYQIQVASDSVALSKDRADLWDSKKVSSDVTNQIRYQGLSLNSGQICYWRVRVWDQHGRVSAWSKTRHWSVGLLKPADWKARWIGDRHQDVSNEEQYYPHYGYHSGYAQSEHSEKWVVIDLGSSIAIDEIRLYPSRSPELWDKPLLFPVAFRVDVATERSFSSFTTIAEEKAFDIKEQISEPYYKRIRPVKGRYVRILVSRLPRTSDGRYAFALAEVEVLHDGVNKALYAKTESADLVVLPAFVSISWNAKRLVDGFFVPNRNHKDKSLPILPSPLLRKEFQVNKRIKRAVLYTSALGLYEAYLNGRKIGLHKLAPEWTDYHTRVQYQTYNVTNLLKQGGNAIGAILADGWYAGPLFSHPERGPYGFDRRFIAQLEIAFEDGSRETIASDSSWKILSDGPIRQASIFDGEIYDARLQRKGWDQYSFDDSDWGRTTESQSPIELSSQMNEPIQIVKEVSPISVTRMPNGKYLFDMGQNLVGWCRLKLPYNPRNEITLRHAEVLNPDSTLYTENLRSAKQTDVYIPGVEEHIIYEPRFTYHGFRFVEVSGLSRVPDLGVITALVVASSSPIAGGFECSDKDINQLWSNILWTQIGNMHSVPTDCPQRDERAGWMGDAQVFAQTAMYNLDMAAFFTKWVRDIRDSQLDDGRFPDYAPQVGTWESFYNSPGWADAGVIVPWRMFQTYGDIRILDRQFESMKKFIDFVHNENKDLIWKNGVGNSYGDWLNGNTIVSADYPKEGGQIPNDVYATAFFAYSTRIVGLAAQLLGKHDDAAYYDSLANAIRKNFVESFISSAGKIKGETQAGYALALEFDLVPMHLKEKSAAHMVEAIRKYDFRISTGIQTTIRLMNQLSQFGYNEIAYKLLESRRFPSWLYSIDQGATTVWERWDGYVTGRGFQNAGMNSFNHYAIGAVGEWMYANLLGIQPDPESPGYAHFYIRPKPGGSITFAKGSYRSIAGDIGVSWREEIGKFLLEVTVPPNTTATIFLPRGKDLREGGVPVHQIPEIRVLGNDRNVAKYKVLSGKYRFEVLL